MGVEFLHADWAAGVLYGSGNFYPRILASLTTFQQAAAVQGDRPDPHFSQEFVAQNAKHTVSIYPGTRNFLYNECGLLRTGRTNYMHIVLKSPGASIASE
jgi:hypothetical protein